MMLVDDDSKLVRVGDCCIKELYLLTDSGIKFNLIPQMIEVNLHENLFSSFTSGNILINDNLNLVSHIPITGEERLRMKFRTPGRLTDLELEFYVYSVTNRVSIKEASQAYSINFVAPEYIINCAKRVSKIYKGTASENIQSIFSDSFGYLYDMADYARIMKTSVYETTQFKQPCTIPFWHPFDAINWISSRAYKLTEKNIPISNFIFYHTLTGFKFSSLDKLFQEIPATLYIKAPANTRIDENGAVPIQREFRTLISLDIENTSNKLENINNGMYSGTLLTHDIVNKKYETNVLGYNAYFDQTSHVDKKRLTRVTTDSLNMDLSSQFLSNLTVYPKHSMAFGIDAKISHSEKYYLQRKNLIQQLENIKIKISVPGDSDRKVGEIVEMIIPSAEQQTEKEIPDPMISGKYIITALKHKIDRKYYSTNMILAKDSYATGVPEIAEFK